MKTLHFWKYQGTGNDFILLDGSRNDMLDTGDVETIARLCDRHFGIGADGLILLRKHPDYDFDMLYFNADGNPGSLCGNGSRCAVAFAARLGWVEGACRFLAVDGPHEARIEKGNWVEVKMGDVHKIERGDGYYFMDTGSPHYVHFVNSLDGLDVVARGRSVRYNDRFREEGTNVNFVEVEGEAGIAVATYERGVEDETLSCGTGVTAAALAYVLENDRNEGPGTVPIRAKGGELAVRFRQRDDGFGDIWLCGPATYVFQGVWPLKP